MSPETSENADLVSAPPSDELQPPLQEAVERIVERRVPEDSLQRALQCAQQRRAVRPSPVDPNGRRKTLARRLAVAALVGSWLVAAVVVALYPVVQDARERARSSTVRNNIRQIGLAVHNYQDIPLLDNSESTWFIDNGIQLQGGTDKLFLFAQRDVTVGTPNTMSPGGEQRVIHTAEFSLVVKDVLELESKLRALIVQYKGYTAEAQVNEPQQSLRSGRWVVRIPVDSFDDFLDAVAELGIPEYRRSNAQDVTEEYVDVTARIAIQKKLEQRLLDLLEKRDGDLEDVIAVEKQLSQVRGEIEGREGRRKYLEHRTELASATIIAREERQYVSPRARTFASEIGLAWTGSFDALRRFGKGLVLVAVAVGPWLPAVIGLAYLALRGIRRARRSGTNAGS
jgi:hypothetical protein